MLSANYNHTVNWCSWWIVPIQLVSNTNFVGTQHRFSWCATRIFQCAVPTWSTGSKLLIPLAEHQLSVNSYAILVNFNTPILDGSNVYTDNNSIGSKIVRHNKFKYVFSIYGVSAFRFCETNAWNQFLTQFLLKVGIDYWRYNRAHSHDKHAFLS